MVRLHHERPRVEAPLGDVGTFHKSKEQDNPGNLVRHLNDFKPLFERLAWNFRRSGRYEKYAFMEGMRVLHVVFKN